MPITKDVNSKANIRQKTDADLLSNLGQPVIATYKAVSIASQTQIPDSGSLPFFVDQNNKDGFELFIDGKLLREGSGFDYEFIDIDANNMSSKIQLSSSLGAGLNIVAIKRGIKKEISQTDSRFTQIYDAVPAGQLQDFIDQSGRLIAVNGVPGAGQFRTFGILGRSSIPDITNDLRAMLGVDRVAVHLIQQVIGEAGAAGEKVFKVVNDDRDLVRFVGGWTNVTDNFGSKIVSSTVADYMEIVFYGTGLNLISGQNSPMDLRATVDGGAEGANFAPVMSGVLGGRNYGANIILPVVSGLTLGLHTVKIRSASVVAFAVIQGFEILNEVTQLKVLPGIAYSRLKKVISSSETDLPYASSFDQIEREGVVVGSLGARGARVIGYIDTDGSVKHRANATNSTQGNLVAADHTYEEVLSNYSFREFGAGRADDFTNIPIGSAVDRAFTIDDGTTTLIGDEFDLSLTTGATRHGLRSRDDGSPEGHLTFTFVGTGLDIIVSNGGVAQANNYEVFVDGASVGFLSAQANTRERVEKIVSGLPYGSHTVRVQRLNGVVGDAEIILYDYLVYGPKKPSIPEGAIEITDYNLMADFVANATAGLYTIATGTLRKYSTRENIYSGTWSETLDLTNYVGGWEAATSTNGGYAQYTFFGTGFELRFRADTNRSNNISVTLNGLAATVANFPSLVSSVYGTGVTFAAGVLDQNDAATTNGSGLRISGLPLGVYTVRFTNNTTNVLSVQALDIITPVHSHKFESPATGRSTLFVGSQGVTDRRNKSFVIDQDTEKLRAACRLVGGSPTTTSNVYLPIYDMNMSVRTKRGGWFRITANVRRVNSGANVDRFSVFVNGISEFGGQEVVAVGTTLSTVHPSATVYLSPGVHFIGIYFRTDSGTLTVSDRSMYVEEL